MFNFRFDFNRNAFLVIVLAFVSIFVHTIIDRPDVLDFFLK